MYNIWIIVLISVMGPIIGSLIGVLKKPSENFMYNMLAFAGGVMLAISFLELIPQAIQLSSVTVAVIGIIIGSLVIFALDKLIPHIHPELYQQEQGKNLKKTAVFLMIGIFLHNFPEGMAIAIGTAAGFKVMLTIAFAIAIHNIPEGICTSAPYYYATKKRLKAFLLSSSTAIPLLLGFLAAHFIFQNIPHMIIGLIVAATAGVMIYISGDELIPAACNKCNTGWSHSTIFSFIIGIIFVVILGGI
ncbi:ZIP family metal transporter [archaeon]|nr:ZIP family metal transporter [archaeon]